MNRIDLLPAEWRSESFDLGYFDGQGDLGRKRPYDDGAANGRSAEYRHGYSVGYQSPPSLPDMRAAKDERTYMDNLKAVGAPEHSPWGYLPCGCTNDGYGRHAAYRLPL